MTDRIPLRLLTVSGIPTIGEFQSGDTLGIEHGGTGVSSVGQLINLIGINNLTLSSNLLDVAIGAPLASNPVAGDSLVWNGNYWVPSRLPLSSLADVAIIDPSAGFMLIYEDSVSSYVPRPINVDDLANVDASAASDGDVLRYSSFLDRWITDPLMKTDLSITPYTKGNIIVADGSSYTDLGKGSNGQVLTASAGAALGVYWANVANALEGLTNVNISSPEQGQALVYFSATDDWQNAVPIGGGGAVDHGLLTGLEDNDHPQYVLSSTNSALSSLVTSVEGSTVSLSSYIAANEGMWSADADVSTLSGLGDVTFTDLSANQHLNWDGTNWINADNDRTEMRVRNGNASPMSRGDVIAIESAHNQNLVNVILADASQTSAMPALGILSQDLAVGEEGIAITFGKADGLNTSGFTEGTIVYVSPTTPGKVVNARPNGVDELVQNVGIVMRAHESNGVIKVTSIGRTNDIPNSTQAEIDGKVNKELVGHYIEPWTEGSGDQNAPTGWYSNATSSLREFDTDPFGNQSIIWKAIDDDVASNGEGGFNSGKVPADASSTYRFSCFIKQENTASGSVYFGPYAFSSLEGATSDHRVDIRLAPAASGTGATNRYFISDRQMPSTDWYLAVAYLHAYQTETGPSTRQETGIYKVSTGEKISFAISDLVFDDPSAVAQSIRAYQFNNPAGTGDVVQFFQPRIDLVDGNEPSISDLLRIVPRTDYVLSSTNQALSSLVTSVEGSTVSLSGYIAANESSWAGGGGGALSGLTDTSISSPTTGQSLNWDGSSWINTTPATGVTDHGLLTGLGDDDHPQYVLSSTNNALSSLVTSVEGSTVSLSSYIAANEGTWSTDNDTTDHTALSNIGTNTHAQIDSHISDITKHFTVASIDHGSIAGLGDNDHPQYVLSSTNSALSSLVTSVEGSTVSLSSYIAANESTWSTDNDTTDHTALSNIGTNTHAQIDSHIADITKHFTVASIDHGSIAGLSDDDHTQYALVDGTRNLQTQTISDTYTGTIGDTSVGYGIETSGNLVSKAGNYLLFSATTGYQFRKEGSTTYTDADFPQSCRDWDSAYNTVLNSSSTWGGGGGGGTSVQSPLVSGSLYHFREGFINSINNRDIEDGTFWVAGGNGVVVDVIDYNDDTRSSVAGTLNSAGDRWTYWPIPNLFRTANAADGDEMLLEARVKLTDSTGTGGGISIGFVDWDGNNAIAYNTAPPADETYAEDHVNMHFDIAHTNVQTAQLDSGGGSTPTVTDLGASYPMSNYVDVWFRLAVHIKYNATSTEWDVQFYINGTAVGSPYSHSLTGSMVPFIGSYYGTGASNTFVFNVDWFDVQFKIGDDASEAYLDMTTL